MNRPEWLPRPRRAPSAIDDLIATHESAPRRPRTAAAGTVATGATGPATGGPGRTARREARDGIRRFRFGSLPQDQPRSLFGEILDWMFAPLLLLWPMSIAFTFFIARSLADAPFDRALVDQANVLVQQVRFAENRPTIRDARALRDLVGSGSSDALFFQVSAGDGALLAGELMLPPPGLYDFPAPGRVKLRNELFRGQEVRVAYTYVQPKDGDTGDEASPALIQVAETLDSRNALANEIIKGVIFPQFLILPLAVILVWFGLGRGLVPLNRLQQRIRERPPDDLSPIDLRGAPEEITPLLESFNDLLARLDASVGAQKRFIADAAHQMKTPLAGLRTQAELALRETEPEELRRRLRQLAIGSERAAHLVNQLLSLARMENLKDSTPIEALDLAPLARATAGEWVTEAIRRGIDFGYESDDTPAPIAGQPVLLGEMIGNLIDNALRYTPQGGSVTARLTCPPSEVVFEVEDTGPGIPAAERGLVFERFYRVLGTNIDGSGLGLAIVREIAQQHNAEIDIEDGGTPQAPCGTRVTIRFPVVAL